MFNLLITENLDKRLIKRLLDTFAKMVLSGFQRGDPAALAGQHIVNIHHVPPQQLLIYMILFAARLSSCSGWPTQDDSFPSAAMTPSTCGRSAPHYFNSSYSCLAGQEKLGGAVAAAQVQQGASLHDVNGGQVKVAFRWDGEGQHPHPQP